MALYDICIPITNTEGIPFVQEHLCGAYLDVLVNAPGTGDITIGPDVAGGRRGDAAIEDRIRPASTVEAVGVFVEIR